MLDFLVPADVRRRFLRLLFAERASGSTAELAERAHVGFASSYRELRAMASAGLASSTRVGRTEVFAANQSHPLADAVRALVLADRTPPDDETDAHTRNALFTLG